MAHFALGGDGTQLRPKVWLPTEDYGMAAGSHDLIDAFGVTGYTIGAAFDINDAGIVVGQLGGYRPGDVGSVAAWWDLANGTWGTIAPAAPATWARLIAVSELEGSLLQAVLQSTREDFCPNSAGTICQSTGTIETWVSSVLVDPRFITVAPPVLPPPVLAGVVCSETADQRDIWTDPATAATRAVGAGRLQFESTDNGIPCSLFAVDCERRVVGWTWETTGTTLLDDYDTMPLSTQDFGSSGRGVAKDGASIGWGYGPSGVVCSQSPLFWIDPATFEDIRSAIPALSIDSDVRGEGISEGPGRFVAGWDETSDYPILWQRTASSSWSAWRLDNASDPDDNFITSSCTATLRQGHDVSSSGWMVAVGRDGFGEAAEKIFVLIPTISPCAGDVNFDGDVDILDLLEVLAAWGPCSPGCLACPADVAPNGVVDFSDVLTVLGSWGDCASDGPPESIPQTVQDCFEKFGSDPIALEACLEAVAAANGGN